MLPSKKNAGILKQYSRGILLALQKKTSEITVEFWWNSTEIPSEYWRRFCPNLPHVFQNYSDGIPLIFWRKEPEFLISLINGGLNKWRKSG